MDHRPGEGILTGHDLSNGSEDAVSVGIEQLDRGEGIHVPADQPARRTTPE